MRFKKKNKINGKNCFLRIKDTIRKTVMSSNLNSINNATHVSPYDITKCSAIKTKKIIPFLSLNKQLKNNCYINSRKLFNNIFIYFY